NNSFPKLDILNLLVYHLCACINGLSDLIEIGQFDTWNGWPDSLIIFQLAFIDSTLTCYQNLNR
ncbi:hypothetical protein, partial [Oenococcus oeni]|uniref:hypothetical protein n=1 Tax=Oenococcus oeni TaxID=1247 RepID=UPI001C5B9A17